MIVEIHRRIEYHFWNESRRVKEDDYDIERSKGEGTKAKRTKTKDFASATEKGDFLGTKRVTMDGESSRGRDGEGKNARYLGFRCTDLFGNNGVRKSAAWGSEKGSKKWREIIEIVNSIYTIML